MAELNITRIGDPTFAVTLPVTGGLNIQKGHLAAVSVNGYAVTASDVANGNCLGVLTSTANNTDGDAGDLNVTYEEGMFRVAVSGVAVAGQSHSNADIGKMSYVLDSQTVSLWTGSNSVKAGPIIKWDGTPSGAGGNFAFIKIGESSNR